MNGLIRKYGTKVTVNNAMGAYLQPTMHSNSKLVKSNGLDVVTGMITIPVKQHDTVTMDGIVYRVWSSKFVYRSGVFKYADIVATVDDFTKLVNIYASGFDGMCSLPSVQNSLFTGLLCKVTTVSSKEMLSLPFTDKQITHTFTMQYVEGIEVGNILVMDNRKFEILFVENPDELNLWTVLQCIEVVV